MFQAAHICYFVWNKSFNFSQLSTDLPYISFKSWNVLSGYSYLSQKVLYESAYKQYTYTYGKEI
jgi:hypothetical protein